MMTVKLILSDIDGTILNDKNIVDSNLKSTIGKLRQRDVPFILASARSPRGMVTIAEELDVLDNPIACYNGALVVKDLQEEKFSTILSHELDLNEVKDIIRTVHEKFPQISVNLYSGADWYVEDVDKWVKIEMDITKLTPIEINLTKLVNQHQVPIHKLLLIGEPEEISKVLAYLQNVNLPNSSFYLSKDNYLEVTNSEVSKEKALRELVDYYGINLDNTMTLGDNFNDVPMLDLAGIVVAMQNAPEEVKSHSDVVTMSNNDNGVSRAIEKYALK